MIALYNEQNDLSFKLTSSGFSRDDEDGWIDVKVIVSQGQHTFTEEFECLESYDILAITNWFKALSRRRLPENVSLHFLEPNISFHFLESTRRWVQVAVELRAEFELDFMPTQFHPEALEDYTREEILKGEYYDPYAYRQKLIFELKRKDFIAIIDKLEAVNAELNG